jgi:NADPH:quinone reductase-like Zn-dependent oxidoreductase
MRLVRLQAPGGLENLRLVEEDHSEPDLGELLVRIRACSLNFHDDMVVHGKIPSADGRIPLTDGAGEVIAVGEGVDKFKVGMPSSAHSTRIGREASRLPPSAGTFPGKLSTAMPASS